MSSFVLVPGAGGRSWVFHRVVEELARRGHEARAVDLPAGDDAAGLRAYADCIVGAAAGLTEPTVVAQSMAGLSAPIAASELPVRELVLLNAMIPLPGETGGGWWGATGQPRAAAELASQQGREVTGADGLFDDLFHDVPEDIVQQAIAAGEPPQAGRPFGEPWPLERWPDVPTRVLVGRDDRLFPAEFQRRVARERLGLDVEVLPGGHLLALSQPQALVDALLKPLPTAG